MIILIDHPLTIHSMIILIVTLTLPRVSEAMAHHDGPKACLQSLREAQLDKFHPAQCNEAETFPKFTYHSSYSSQSVRS